MAEPQRIVSRGSRSSENPALRYHIQSPDPHEAAGYATEDYVNTALSTVSGSGAEAVAAHVAQPDPHEAAGYATEDYVNTALSTVSGSGAEAVAAHVAQPDPHTQYTEQTDVDAALLNHTESSSAHKASQISNDSTVAGAKVSTALGALLGYTATNSADLASHAAATGTAVHGLGTMATVNDAPSDGTTYGRKDGAWAAAGGTPAGTGTELQYRDGTAFGAVAGSSWDGSTLGLTAELKVEGGIDSPRGAATSQGFGYQSLNSNTAGNNVAAGYQALLSNTSGNDNAAFGRSAMDSNTTGGYNFAGGGYSLRRNTSGRDNACAGYESLYSNTIGTHNSGLGSRSGRFVSGGAEAEELTYGVYLGHDTRAAATDSTNEIVIGALARGNGSNTATIGNSSITATYLQGTVYVDGTALGTMATEDSGDYGPLASVNTWTQTNIFNVDIILGDTTSWVRKNTVTGSLILSGGTEVSTGADVLLRGGSHADGAIGRLRSSGTTVVEWMNSTPSAPSSSQVKIGNGYVMAGTQVRSYGNTAHGGTSLISPSSDLNNQAIGDVSTIRINNSANIDITGFVAGVEGQEVTLFGGSSSYTITLVYNSFSSSANNRLVLPGLTNLSFTNFESVTLRYTNSRWRCVAVAKA